MQISPPGMLEKASYPILGTDPRHTSTFGAGGPTVPSIEKSFGKRQMFLHKFLLALK